MFAPLPFTLALRTRWLGRRLFFLPEVDSTNRLLREMAEHGTPPGSVVLADFQSTGRGRRGRGWVTPPGSSLLFSFLLCPPRLTTRHGLLSLVMGVAVARALEEHLALRPSLKWPNDVLLEGRKCCGILLESTTTGSGAGRIVAGIGVNVNQTGEMLEGLPEATSLRVARGEAVERGPLFASLLESIEKAYDAFEAGWRPHDEWKVYACLPGLPITVFPATGEQWSGTALDLAPDGSLIVEDETGQVTHLHAADISVRARD